MLSVAQAVSVAPTPAVAMPPRNWRRLSSGAGLVFAESSVESRGSVMAFLAGLLDTKLAMLASNGDKEQPGMCKGM
jgi:hypothetical protein